MVKILSNYKSEQVYSDSLIYISWVSFHVLAIAGIVGYNKNYEILPILHVSGQGKEEACSLELPGAVICPAGAAHAFPIIPSELSQNFSYVRNAAQAKYKSYPMK